MANTRPYTREELKSLRRANLQNLFKIHNLKGANGTNTLLIDTLVDYFASPKYREAHPPPPYQHSSTQSSGHPSLAPSAVASVRPRIVAKVESRYKGLPLPSTRPLAGGRRVVSTQGAQVKRAGNGATNSQTSVGGRNVVPSTQDRSAQVAAAARRIIEAVTTGEAGPSRSTESEETRVDDGEIGEVSAAVVENSMSTYTSIDQSAPLSPFQTQALIDANNAQWQERISVLEKTLIEQIERLRGEMREVKAHVNELEARVTKDDDEGTARTWSPWQGRTHFRTSSDARPSRSTQSKISQTPAVPSTSQAPSNLGKRRYPEPIPLFDSTSSDHMTDRSEAKRVRFDGREEGQLHPGFRTPSPKKAMSSAFGPDFFARPNPDGTTSSPPEIVERSIVLPRTPSPSRQGVVPDNSQTPRLPNTWRKDEEMDDEDVITKAVTTTKDNVSRTPMSVAMAPEFSSTPEPPLRRPISPTMERSVSASSDRLTPGRILISLPGSTPASSELGSDRRETKRADQIETVQLSTVTDLERIEESEELSSRPTPSPVGPLRFPTVRPGAGDSFLATPSGMNPKRHPPHLSLLAPPALISRNSRAGSELPTLSRTLSPPPRPRSASAIHGASTPPRHTFPLNLPTFDQPRVRSASADYMHVAMHGLEDDGLGGFGDEDGVGLHDLASAGGGVIWAGAGGEVERVGVGLGRLGKKNEEIMTPAHRTMLGTERYNDTRFGDIPVGMWESPKVDLSGPETPF
ncbi:hypothetical protein IAR55_000670 [Kwoniella newhampshirensis]|uniref:SAP domain-containing protein n=1 Tax=Kwoniella newhampshirensis TaxID=1651941 RepID=A0AAW0Z7H6_9TREE